MRRKLSCGGVQELEVPVTWEGESGEYESPGTQIPSLPGTIKQLSLSYLGTRDGSWGCVESLDKESQGDSELGNTSPGSRDKVWVRVQV